MLEKLDISFSGLGRDDIGTDVDIDINNSPDGGNSNNSNDEAVIALGVESVAFLDKVNIVRREK